MVRGEEEGADQAEACSSMARISDLAVFPRYPQKVLKVAIAGHQSDMVLAGVEGGCRWPDKNIQ